MIDAHQHFWSYDPSAYDWISESMRASRRDFLPADLAPLAAVAGITGTVAVQARQSLEETDWLLSLADSHPELIKGVVAWVHLRKHGALISATLDAYLGRPAFKGVRHVLQGEPDAYMDDSAFKLRHAPPSLNEHGNEVLAELGYAHDRIAELRTAKVLA